MHIRRLVIAAMLSGSVALSAGAADLTGYDIAAQCTFAEDSQLALLPESEIEITVAKYYEEASAALKSADVVGSKSPAFLWASETKFQCGKAIGYLKGGTLDEVSTQKCDCFHARFVKYR